MAPKRVDRRSLREVAKDEDFEVRSCSCQPSVFITRVETLTPGSVADACMNDEMQMKNR